MWEKNVENVESSERASEANRGELETSHRHREAFPKILTPLKKWKNPPKKSTFFTLQIFLLFFKKFLGRNGQILGKSSQKTKTNSSPAPTVVGAVAAISLMCILPMAMAYGPSPFFPRLSYHKVNV